MRFALDDSRTILRAGIDGTKAELSFPDLARDGGTLWLIYKDGKDGSTEGAVRVSTSTDEGETWSASNAILAPVLPVIAGPAGAMTLANRTWFATALTSAGLPSTYAVVTVTSTDQGASWVTSGPITTHPFTSWVACAGPAIQVASGDLLLPLYGADLTGNNYVAVMLSTDNGATWTTLSTLAVAGVDIQEPMIWETIPGFIVALCRGADHNIRRWASANSGSSWSGPSIAWTDDSRVNACRLRSGRWILLSRDLTGAGQLRYSDDDLTTFSAPQLLIAPDNRTTYADLLETTTDGKVLTVFGAETLSTTPGSPIGDIRARFVADGDTAAGRAMALKTRDGLGKLAWDLFCRPDTAYAPGSADSGHKWKVIMTSGTAPGLIIASNRLTAPSGASAIGVIDCGTADVDLEADLSWTGTSSGFGIRFRVDPVVGSNLLADFETAAANLRLYTQPTATGTATKIGELALPNAVPATGKWVTLRVRANGNVIKVYVDGDLKLEVVSSFNNSKTCHGVNLAGTGSSSHYCRRFTAKGA